MIGAALRATPAVSPAAAAAAASRSHGNGERPSPPAALSRTDAGAGLIASCGSAGPTTPSNARDCRSASGAGEGAAAVAGCGWAEAWALGASETALRIAVGRTATGRAAEARLRAGAGRAVPGRASGARSEAAETRGVSLRRDDSAATGLAATEFDGAGPTSMISVGTVATTESERAGGTGSATAGSADAGSATTSGSGAVTGRRAGSSEAGST